MLAKPIQLMFVCTHNSRRSHISQQRAQASAAYLNVDNVQTFSGGTEATAFNMFCSCIKESWVCD